jgi:hypothetical protein
MEVLIMKDTSNHGFGSTNKLRYKKSIWVLFVFLFLIVMIIPSIIIMFFEAGAASVHFNDLFTVSKQDQASEYFISYTAQNLQYKIWLPNEKSFNLYLDLIPQLHLAGTAVWDLNQMNSVYWNKIF